MAKWSRDFYSNYFAGCATYLNGEKVWDPVSYGSRSVRISSRQVPLQFRKTKPNRACVQLVSLLR
jgi:hypothetical protein